MDKVMIEGLQVDAFVGIYDWEHEQAQPLVIDLTMAWDNRPAAATEQISDALDYDRVSQAVTQLIAAKPWQLIETVAEQIAALVLSDFSVVQVMVKVAKPQAVPSARQVAVMIERQR
jgi:dihydroneopterin aldolase